MCFLGQRHFLQTWETCSYVEKALHLRKISCVLFCFVLFSVGGSFLMRKWCVSSSFILRCSRSVVFFFQKSASGSNSQACLISGTKHKTGTISSCLVLPCSKTEYLAYIPNALFHPLFPLNLTCKTPRLDDYGSLLSRYIRCDRSQSTEEATGVFSEEEGNSRNVLKGDLSDTLHSWPQKLNPLLSQLTR